MIYSYTMLLQTTNRRIGLSVVRFSNIYSRVDIENILNLISNLAALITQLSNVHIVLPTHLVNNKIRPNS